MGDALMRGQGLEAIDATVTHEVGVLDTLPTGSDLSERLTDWVPAAASVRDEKKSRLAADMFNSLAATFVYAIPWLSVFLIELLRPETLRLPGHAAAPLSLALMFSLVASGGFIQAISRCGQFYVEMRQPALAAWICGYLFRLGSALAVTLAIVGVAVGWYFHLASWPYLALTADEFVVLTVLWMSWGVISVRRERWRVPITFAAGVAAFVACRLVAQDALIAQLAASAIVLAASLGQVPSVFALPKNEEPVAVPLPRVSVRLYRALPFFWYGSLYFCFLFADRFVASASGPAPIAPFSMATDYTLGMDIALLTFLFAAASVEFANLHWSHLLRRSIQQEYTGDPAALRLTCRRIHRRTLAVVIGGFSAIALLMGVGMKLLLPAASDAVWRTAFAGDVGYLLLAIGLLNGLLLSSLNRPWLTVKIFAFALAANITVGYVTSYTQRDGVAVVGLIAGAAWLAVHSMAAVRATIRRADHAIAAA